MEQFFVALVVAALSGLTLLAYQHAKAYQRLFEVFLQWVIPAVMISGFIWDVSNSSTLSAVVEFVTPSKYEAASTAATSLRVVDWRFLVGLGGAYFYLFFLSIGLPALLGEEKPPKNKGKPRGK